MDNLTDVAVFVRVVERGSFTRAADELELSRAVVSKYLTRLEERLGVRLLNRTTRRLSLTEAGAELFAASQGALERIAEAEGAITRLQREPRGTLKINAPMSFGILELAPALPEFLRRHPDIQVDLRMDDRQVDLVEEGFDVGVRITQRMAPSSLVARRLATCRQWVCAAPSYLAEHGTPETPEDLSAHNCILYQYASAANVWRFRAPGGRDIAVAVTGNLRANNGIAEREAAVGGVGILLTPSFYVGEELRSGRLVRLLSEYSLPELGIHAVYPKRSHVPPKVRVFVEFLARRFGGRPAWERGL
ncbi:MAG: LysR family transcriptional regulator [Betaproteobacteria bacterium]|nr:LysR family transcriptional regulator [Betaproteobacteria bacterium]